VEQILCRPFHDGLSASTSSKKLVSFILIFFFNNNNKRTKNKMKTFQIEAVRLEQTTEKIRIFS
jgi:hypothetical protein